MGRSDGSQFGSGASRGPATGPVPPPLPAAAGPPRGLAACGQCHGIFPGPKLAPHEGRLLCADCFRKFGPVPGAEPTPAPPAPSPAPRTGPVTGSFGPRTFRPTPAPATGPVAAPHVPDATGAAAPPAEPSIAPVAASGARGRPFGGAASSALPPWASAPPARAPGAATPAAPTSPDVPRPVVRSALQPIAPAAPRPAVGVATVAPPVPAPRASQTGEVAGPLAPPVPSGFDEYARLRLAIDGGDDSLETRRRAAELASRLGLHLESIEHYRRCVELAPHDDRLRLRLENVERVAGPAHAAVPAPAPARRVAEEARPFWENLGDAFAYPLRGSGKGVLLVGGLLFGCGQLLASVNVYAGILSLMLWGYVASYLYEVINTTAAGKASPPELPEASNVLESYVFPFFSYVTCTLVAFAPFAVTLFATFKGWLPAPVAPVLLLATFGLGFFVLPMTLMVRAMFQSIGEAANPALVYGSIGRIFPDYLAMFVATCVLWVAYTAFMGAAWFLCWITLGVPTADAVLVLDGARILSWVLFTVLSWPVFLYVWMLQGHLLGRLYRQSLRRLAWFVPPTDATQSARRLSVGLGLAAAGALALLSGAVWVGSKVLVRAVGNPNSPTFGAASPVRPGARLTYYWENTDGLAGLTTYTFSEAPGKKVAVSATTRIAGEEYGPTRDDIGVFDPETGIFESATRSWGDAMLHDGVPGTHVPFYGPRRASPGATYVNDWPVVAAERWRDAWDCWKVHDQRTTDDLYFDTKTGVLVGARHGGMGYVITEWLVLAEGVPGLGAGPPPNRGFDAPTADGPVAEPRTGRDVPIWATDDEEE